MRIQYAGAVYHVMSRGQRRDAIVYDDHDRRIFCETLGEVCERTGWRWHAWVLLDNHYHWLLETPEPNLVSGMQWFQTTYRTRFRLRHGLCGHVFQGRYKAIVIEPDSDTYFLTVSSYIHLNPVRAGQLTPPETPLEGFRWSSYPSFLRRPALRPAYLSVDRVLGNLGLSDDRNGRRGYAEYMSGRCADVRDGNQDSEEWKPIRRGWCLGSEAFREDMLRRAEDRLEGTKGESTDRAMVREHNESTARRMVAAGLELFNLDPLTLDRIKKTDARKRVIAWWIRTHSAVSNEWVAQALYMGHPMNASASVRMVRDARKNELARLRKKLVSTLRI